MRISLDLDDTLLRRPDQGFIDPSFPPLRRGAIADYLRVGTKDLIQALVIRDCEIWVYTNSYRGKSELLRWFGECQLPIVNVVNQQLYDMKRVELGKLSMRPCKSPHWFNIDLHVDDSTELEEDALLGGFRVLRIAPDDVDWVVKIVSVVDSLISE